LNQHQLEKKNQSIRSLTTKDRKRGERGRHTKGQTATTTAQLQQYYRTATNNEIKHEEMHTISINLP